MAITAYEQTGNALGAYPDVETAITAAVTVQLVDGLDITLEADRTYWINGVLKYTAKVSNSSGVAFTTPDLIFSLSPTAMTFVDDSVKINDINAPEGTQLGQYEYSNSKLIVHLNTIADGSPDTTVEYSVTRA